LQSKPQNIAASDVPCLLGPGFDALRRPVWVFDDIRKRKVYANRAAIELWGAASLDELLARDFSDQSPAVRVRMEDIAKRIEGGAALSRNAGPSIRTARRSRCRRLSRASPCRAAATPCCLRAW
jgi:PAS domain-containing protein